MERLIMAKSKKEQYYMESIGWEKFYTTDIELYNKSCLHEKWQNIYDSLYLWFILSMFVSFISVVPQEEFAWKSIVAWCFTGLGVLGMIITLVLVAISSKKIDKYEWKKEFEKSKEFHRQCNKYAKIEKQKQDKLKTERARKLVESYEILDNKEMSKEEKITLIKKYIDVICIKIGKGE